VYNQIDRVPGLAPEIVRDSHGKILNIKASAVTGAGVALIRQALLEVGAESARLPGADETRTPTFPLPDASERAPVGQEES